MRKRGSDRARVGHHRLVLPVYYTASLATRTGTVSLSVTGPEENVDLRVPPKLDCRDFSAEQSSDASSIDRPTDPTNHRLGLLQGALSCSESTAALGLVPPPSGWCLSTAFVAERSPTLQLTFLRIVCLSQFTAHVAFALTWRSQ